MLVGQQSRTRTQIGHFRPGRDISLCAGLGAVGVISRCDSVRAFKRTRKMGGILKTDDRSHFFHRMIGFQEGTSFIHAMLTKPVFR